MDPYSFTTLLALCLTAHRVTRMVTFDKVPFLKKPRDAFVNRWGVWDAPKEMKGKPIHPKGTNRFMSAIAYMIECDWCAGFWVSGILTGIHVLVTGAHPWYAFLLWMASSSAVGLIAEREQRDYGDDE